MLQEVKQDGPVEGVAAPNRTVDESFKSLQSLLDKYTVYFGISNLTAFLLGTTTES